MADWRGAGRGHRRGGPGPWEGSWLHLGDFGLLHNNVPPSRRPRLRGFGHPSPVQGAWAALTGCVPVPGRSVLMP